MRSALITGISGQDGSLLADSLLAKGYQVYAISNHELFSGDNKAANYSHLENQITWACIDLKDTEKVISFLEKASPDEVYHLGAQSFPSAGFNQNLMPFEGNVEGVYGLLAATYQVNPNAKFFFAGSSEIFGDNPKLVMTEDEKFYPKTMYGISKLVGHELIRNYRQNIGKFAVTGFLFNHESSRRGEEFVTRKITLAAAKIKLGLQKRLVLGSLDIKRDWSAAEDFIEGFQLALGFHKAQDYVFSSGKLHTIGEFAEIAFKNLGLKHTDYIDLDPAFVRPSHYDLVGDTNRANRDLNWKPRYSFEQIIERMVKADYDSLSRASQ